MSSWVLRSSHSDLLPGPLSTCVSFQGTGGIGKSFDIGPSMLAFRGSHPGEHRRNDDWDDRRGGKLISPARLMAGRVDAGKLEVQSLVQRWRRPGRPSGLSSRLAMPAAMFKPPPPPTLSGCRPIELFEPPVSAFALSPTPREAPPDAPT